MGKNETLYARINTFVQKNITTLNSKIATQDTINRTKI